MSLAEAKIGVRLRIAFVHLDAEVAAWLRAVGLCAGEEFLVLRRATLGGPLHVRMISGGEFAVARELASSIAVEAKAA
jgi:Fe2+ transport system protein FeoA